MALILLTLAVGATRLAALPGSLWHQDEAEFASSVLDFDVEWNRPHPPWFPLWILMGKAVHHLGGVPPDRALQGLGVLFATLALPPLVLLWGVWLRRELALAAALLYLFLPGVWMLSGRAFSDTAALTLLVAALACWLDPRAGRGRIALGSVLAGLTVLVRPHHAILLALPLVVAWRRGADRRALVGPAAGLGAAGALGLLVWGAPPAVLWKALRLVAGYQKALLETGSAGFAELGLSRALLAPGAAALWLAAAVAGAVVLARTRVEGRGALLAAAVLPSFLILFTVLEPVEPRYWLPFLALSSGPVVVAVAAPAGRWGLLVPAAAVALSLRAVVPGLATWRHEVSPPIRALSEADRRAMANGWTVVADLNLRPFAEWRRLAGRLGSRVVYDVELGRVVGIPPPWSVVALYTDRQDAFVVEGGPPLVFEAATPLLDRLLPGPYRTATVVPGARVRPAPRRERGR